MNNHSLVKDSLGTDCSCSDKEHLDTNTCKVRRISYGNSSCPIKFSTCPIKFFRKSLYTAKTPPLNAQKVKQEDRFDALARSYALQAEDCSCSCVGKPEKEHCRVCFPRVTHTGPGLAPAQPRLLQQGNLGQSCVEKRPNDAACVPAAPPLRLLSLRAAISSSACAPGSAPFKCFCRVKLAQRAPSPAQNQPKLICIRITGSTGYWNASGSNGRGNSP